MGGQTGAFFEEYRTRMDYCGIFDAARINTGKNTQRIYAGKGWRKNA
jgi:hypothetical protein